MARRIQYDRHGDSSVLQLVTDQPVPARTAGQVLIDNRATSINPVDYKARSGRVMGVGCLLFAFRLVGEGWARAAVA